MSDLLILTILLGILGFAVIGLLWFVGNLEKRVKDLERNADKIGGEKK